jgi:HK97 family phage prohead protease
MQKKVFALKISEAAEGRIKGYASTFGNIDFGDDIVDKGAFKKTLKDSKGVIPILADHDPSKQIGWNLTALEDEKGLLVEGQLNMESPLARERFALAKQGMELGAKMGLSIGYLTIKAEPDEERPMVRRLKEVRLMEYSLVTFPMNPKATLTAAKSIRELTEEFFERAIELGATPSEIDTALRTREAAKTSDDPNVVQSIDSLIQLLNGGNNGTQRQN